MTYAKFLVKRLLQGVFVVWGVITVLFGLRAVAPGDPVLLVLHHSASAEAKAEVRSALGLDQPIPVQYLDYLAGLINLEGDFARFVDQLSQMSLLDAVSALVGIDLGFSFRAGRDVNVMVLERLPATLELAIAATIIAVVIAIPLGVISATRRNEPADYGATLFSLVGISTPNFWLGIMLILVFAVRFELPLIGSFPTGGRGVGFVPAVQTMILEQNLADLLTWLRHIILPAITLGTYFTAMITRLTRSGMLEEYGKPYVTANEAKGLPGVLNRYKHVLRNTMIPIITVLGLQMGTLIGGAVITETVFNWPGLGERLIQAIRVRDWPVMQGIIICIGIGFVIINIVVDATYAYLNPRVIDE